MAETVVKTVENVDRLFPQIVVNGEVYESENYVAPTPSQSVPQSQPATVTPEPQSSQIEPASTQGEDIYGVNLNDVLHNFVDNTVPDKIQQAVESLDVPSSGGSGKYIKSISQTDGKITATEGNITDSVTPDSSDPVTSGAVANHVANHVPPMANNAKAIDTYLTCSTSAEVAEKTVDLDGFSLTYGARLIVYIRNTNTYSGTLKLNVNNTGAKNIRLNGIITSTSWSTLSAGTYECFYDGSVWNMWTISSSHAETMCHYNFSAGDFRDYVLIADITAWYNSQSSSTVQTIMFNGILTACRKGVAVGDLAMLTLYVSYYRYYNNPNGLFNKDTSIIRCTSNAKNISACVVKYDDKIYLAIKRKTIQALDYMFHGTVVGFKPLFTSIDTRTETVEELFTSSEIPLPPIADDTYNLQCTINNGAPSYSWQRERFKYSKFTASTYRPSDFAIVCTGTVKINFVKYSDTGEVLEYVNGFIDGSANLAIVQEKSANASLYYDSTNSRFVIACTMSTGETKLTVATILSGNITTFAFY